MYDLLLNGIKTLQDIKMIKILKQGRDDKEGNDGWKISAVSLFVNGGIRLPDSRHRVYHVSFDTPFPQEGVWLDNEPKLGQKTTYRIPHQTLRRNSNWSSYYLNFATKRELQRKKPLKSRISSMAPKNIIPPNWWDR